MKTIDDYEFELSSGRKIYANRLIIGINPELEISGGYDNGIHPGSSYEFKDGRVVEESGSKWTAEERRELADYMIALWTKFRESA